MENTGSESFPKCTDISDLQVTSSVPDSTGKISLVILLELVHYTPNLVLPSEHRGSVTHSLT